MDYDYHDYSALSSPLAFLGEDDDGDGDDDDDDANFAPRGLMKI